MHESVLLAAVLVAVVVIIHPSLGCQHPIGYEPWNISQRVGAADLVVWGRVVGKHGLRIPPTTSYTAEVEFLCRVKGDSSDLVGQGPHNVSNMGLVNPAACVANNVDIDAYYFFFLTYEFNVLVPQEINLHPAVIKDCEENRQEFFQCCWFYPTFCRPVGGATSCRGPDKPKPTDDDLLPTTVADRETSAAAKLVTPSILLATVLYLYLY